MTYEKNTYSFTPACACVAQDWPQTFQWGTNRVGIIFEETNLTGSVKSSIQDDLVHILSFNVASNAAFEPLSAGDVFFGKYKGRMVLDQEALPEKIPEFYYITNAETNYFVVTREDITNYLAKIALTNSLYAAVNSLPNFVDTINHATTTRSATTTIKGSTL